MGTPATETKPCEVEPCAIEPKQARSRYARRRIMAAARELLWQRGERAFTIQELTAVEPVSISSIYLRFGSKDGLLRAVITEQLRALNRAEKQMVAALMCGPTTLPAFMAAYVEGYAALLSEYAPLLRASMERASHDAHISAKGKEAAHASCALATQAIASFGKEIAGQRPQAKAHAAYQIIFSALARVLGLDSTVEEREKIYGQDFRQELVTACIAYLQHTP